MSLIYLIFYLIGNILNCAYISQNIDQIKEIDYTKKDSDKALLYQDYRFNIDSVLFRDKKVPMLSAKGSTKFESIIIKSVKIEGEWFWKDCFTKVE